MNESKRELNGLGSLLLSEEALSLEICESEIDFSKLCRTCLRETTDNDLCNDTLCIINANGKLVRVYEMFEVATGLKIESSDRLPHHICSVCLKSVNSLYAFRTQSQRADEILRGILGRVKMEAVEELEDNTLEEVVELTEEIPDEEDDVKHDAMYGEHLEIEQSVDEYTDILDEEIMEIEQLDEVSESEEKLEVLDMEVPPNYFSCPFCTRIFYLQRDMIQHYKDDHPKEKPFKCDECLASFAHIQSLRRHTKIHIPRSKEKMCPLCGRMFHRADDLKRHIRTHTDERPYPCPMCQKAFKQHTELKDHMLSHTQSKSYKCTLCSKEWRSRNGWYLHMKAHQGGEKVYRKRTKKEVKTQTGLIQIVTDVPTVTTS